MKKILFGVAFIATLASCSQNETLEMSERNAINFRVITEYASRAVEYNSVYLMPEINVTAVKPDNSELFSDKTWTNNNGTWSTTNPIFWPNSTEELSFYGYFPTGLTTGLLVGDFMPDTYAKNQKDVMAAFNKCSQGKDGTVALHFKHLLSQIAVQAKNMNENYTIKVRGVKLSGFKTGASIHLPDEITAAGTPVNKEWSEMSGTACYVADQDIVELNETAQPITGVNDDGDKVSTFMVLPQQLEAWDGVTYGEDVTGAYIGVLCQIIRNTDNVIIYPKQDGGAANDLYAYTAVPIDTKLEMGKKYTYTLAFFDGEKGGAGLVDPRPGEVTDVDGDPDNDGLRLDPDPSVEDSENNQGGIISTKAIGVNVSCDDWEEGETVDKDMSGASGYKADDFCIDITADGKKYKLLFAKMNVGATKPSDYGKYFVWGAKEGYTAAEITDDEKYSFDADSYNALSEKENWGDMQGKQPAILEEWGDEWTIPTKDHWQALYDEVENPDSDVKKILNATEDDVAGLRVYIDSNGDDSYQEGEVNIFLPAAGYFSSTTNNKRGERALYWSSTPTTNELVCAYQLYFNLKANKWSLEGQYAYVYNGHPVRPVRVIPMENN